MKKHPQLLVMLSLCLVGMFGSLALLGSSPLTRTYFHDPLVFIARDMTVAYHCQTTYTLNLNTPQVRTISMPCSAGSNIDTFMVPLSTALTHHWAYVPLLPVHASAREQAQHTQQIQALIQKTQLDAQAISKSQIRPLTACGSSGSQQSQFTQNGDTIKYRIFYFREPSCTTIFIGEVDEGLFGGTTPISWGHFYAGSLFNVPCYYLNGDPNNYLFIDVNTTVPYNSQTVFENYLSNNCTGTEVDHLTPGLT